MPTRPLLAAKVDDLTKLQFPLLATPKIDGIRALRLQDTLLSRSFKQIPNTHVRNYLTSNCPQGLDGELILLNASFHETQSGIMSENGIPDFRYLVFDYCPDGLEMVGYDQRIALLSSVIPRNVPEVSIVPTTLVFDPEHLGQYEETCLKEGYEGVCLRHPSSPYKSGRSTLREHFLLKLKRFQDAEAKVVGFQELQRNGNAPQFSELGLLKRGHSKEGLSNGSCLGALIVEDCTTGVNFNVGTGFSAEQRVEFWNSREQLMGKLVTYKYQPYGTKDAPRIPVFKGFRDILDL